MNLAVISNAWPLPGTAQLQRASALAPGLAALASVPLPFTLMVPGPPLPEGIDPGVEVHFISSFDSVFGVIQSLGIGLVVVDYDARAATPRDRTAFLRIAGTLAAAASGRFRVALAMSEESGLDDSDRFSPIGLSNRQIVSRLVERCGLRLTFSAGSAERLERRFRHGFKVIPAGSALPVTDLSRREARDRLGFGEERQDLLLGVLGKHAALNHHLLLAGLREALRLSPGCRVLYLGPDGKRFKERPLPVPFLDAGTPSPEDASVRLRAMDLVLMPLKDGCRFDDGAITACLRHGTQVVSSTPNVATDPEFGPLPDGFVIVRGNELGDFLEAIEAACVRSLRRQPGGGSVREGLEAYYEERLSASAALRWLGQLGVES